MVKIECYIPEEYVEKNLRPRFNGRAFFDFAAKTAGFIAAAVTIH